MALTLEEAEHLFSVAINDRYLRVTLWVAMLCLHSGASPDHLKHVRLGDADWREHTLRIRRNGRMKTLSLNAPATRALQRIVERAQAHGAILPEHYILPALLHGGPYLDPTKPAGRWYESFWMLRARAAQKVPRFAQLTLNDLKHTVAVWQIEAPDAHLHALGEIGAIFKRYAGEEKTGGGIGD
jgi:integrase